MNTSLTILSILGLFLSCYALYVEWKTKTTRHYKPLCNFGPHFSCTKAFTSPYAKLLGLPNAFYGMLFYVLMTLLAVYSLLPFMFYLSIIACIGSLGLAYLSYYKLKNFCIVCTSTYIINILLLIISYQYF
ncbi:MAG: vitamin K epoxide reductase family protein [Nanoarchaeota archaeon]|nr:vitamin K epoxide reductase family protein [Nanoarchaeota archaeon]